MPKRHTAKKGFPVKPKDCYANRHLTGPEYKVYDVMMAFAVHGRTSLHGKDSKEPLYFSASVKPTLVNACAQSVNQVTAMKDRLLELGWLILEMKGTRRNDGRVTPDTYRILTHEEYAAANPGECPPYEYAPDFETAQAYGVRHGQKLQEQNSLPKNFWPTEPVLRSMLDKITDDEVSVYSDDEMAALGRHLEEIAPKVLPDPEDCDRTQKTDAGLRKPMPDRYQNPESTVTRKREQPSPENRNSRHQFSGENPIPPSGSPIPDTQPTQSHGVVCDVSSENLSAMDVDKEVGELIKGFVKHNAGKPGGISKTQRQQLADLVKAHGRETFRGAARVWLKDIPWNDKTTHPFLTFINGFEGYAAKPGYDRKEEARKKQQASDGDRASRFWNQKFRNTDRGEKLDPGGEYLASLRQEDRDYITKVAAAKNLDEMPPDNGKSYAWDCLEFYAMQREVEAAAAAKEPEDGKF